jgi:FkbM family methyltransferase
MDESRLYRLAGWAIGKLGPERAVGIKQSILVTGRLDYPGKHIQMALDHATQIPRLNACRKEPETVAWLESNMRAGDVFFDIGANVGAYSFVADTVAAGQCTIFSFEPSYSTFAALVANVQLNGCGDRIRTLQVALSNETKLETFNYSSTTAGAAMHAVGLPIDEEGRPFVPAYRQAVLAYRLDDLRTQFSLPVPNHIKVDVDGAELRVVGGAPKTLSDPALRSMLIEIDERKEFGAELVRAIESHGLQLVSKNQRNGPGLFNYVFARRYP